MSRILDENDRRQPVSDEDRLSVFDKFIEVNRRLKDKKGSTLDPYTVLDKFQCAIEGRDVMPGSAAYSVVDGTSDCRSIPFTAAQWVMLANLPLELIGCTVSTRVALRHYGYLGRYLGHALLSTKEEIERDCGQKAANDLAYCLGAQLLELPTAQQLDESSNWWIGLLTHNFDHELVEVRVARNHLGIVPLTAISQISYYWPSQASTDSGVTTLGQLLTFSKPSLIAMFHHAYPETNELWKAELQHKVDIICEWLDQNDLSLAAE